MPRIEPDYCALRVLAAPGVERHFVARYSAEALPLQRAQDALSGNLLPPTAGLLVGHEKVLMVQAGQMEAQRVAIDFTVPHQTGVAERSIGGEQNSRTQLVVEHVVIGQVAYWIRSGLIADHDSDDHVCVADVMEARDGSGLRIARGGEDPLKQVH